MKLFNYIKRLSGIVINKFDRNTYINHSKISNLDNHYEGINPVEVFFKNMGPHTANEIIKHRIDRHIINEYGIDELANKDRYYIARVREVNGTVIHTMLIDKDNGMVRSLCQKVVG